MKAYYFGTTDKKLRYDGNRLVVVGETHSVDSDKLKLCQYGLHASVRLLDALQYAPSAILYGVELSGKIIEGEDKVCAEHRMYLWEVDCTDILKEFARKQAAINIEKIKPYCNDEDYELILHWLKTGDESAESAARSAAWSAAMSAARAAAMSAESAARSAESAAWAAESAARSAAWAAARSAESAARSAAWSAAEEMLVGMIEEALKK